LKNLAKKSKKNEEIAKKKEEEVVHENIIHEKVNDKIEAKTKKFNLFGIFFSSVFFVGSSVGLFFLYKFRNRFIK